MKKSVVSLGELCEVQNGFAFDSRFFSQEEKGLPLIRIRDIMRGFSTTYYSGEYDDAYIVNNGDFLIGMDGDFNIGEWHGGEALLNQRVCRLLPTDKILPKFIYYFIPKALQEINAHTSFATVKHLSSKQVRQIAIPLLSISEQQRIVSLLDAEFAKIDTLKANAERNLQNAKDLFCSIQTKVLENKSWKRYTLDDICNLITDGTHRTPKYQQQGIPFLSVKNITGGFLDMDDTKYISEEEHRELVKRCKPEKGDVLYSKVGTTGVAQLIDTDEEFSIFVSLALLKVKQEIVKNTLLVKILNSPYVREQAKKRTRGTANKNFVISDIKAVEVFIPPYNEQDTIEQTIDAYWSKVSSLQANYEKTIALCDDLKQALLRKAFNGEI